jgi:hypothetical protein
MRTRQPPEARARPEEENKPARAFVVGDLLRQAACIRIRLNPPLHSIKAI